MSLRSWTNKSLTITLLLLAGLLGGSLYLLSYSLSGNKEAPPQSVIHQVRLAINPLMLYLEQHHDNIGTTEVQTELNRLATQHEIGLAYVQLDGTVTFSSAALSPIAQDNVNRFLRYDMYSGQQSSGLFQIAFPVIDKNSQSQVGNAVYFLPEAKVFPAQSNYRPVLSFVIIALIVLCLALLLIFMKRTIQFHLISPILQLRLHAEAILKGNYEQQPTYASLNEMGELYSMFDQMRTEIMYLSMQRIQQEKAQKELITNISHEIKTPITTIKAYIDSILEGVCSDTDTMLEYIEIMRTHTDKMARLVEDLLLQTLQDLGQITVEPREQYSRDILYKILKPIGHYVRTNELNYIEPEEIPNVLINMDANRIEQVISNLVSNSLKHTSPGDSIRIDVHLEAGMLKVIIADTGSGIRPQDMPFIFERYFRRNPGSDAHRGTGLGLSICKTIIEAHGGTISFTSKHGEGTTFNFTLPLC
ncbi:HAMP domain-containing histidine kinase [Paenibacillus sp. KQZ6P-2]|uniref:histidine kinase n=1 Tax=Paenibacillus mangrovi TaxID=2931978 RepID=A0A9X1WNE2_9BACL|nr:HAMP domain-containing sensor histidine kinase [Paenibacillus mangrovi]MCJ8010205.1 HAMP domain-containing histidine kinase [Paenibacillus mangrovi]